MKKVTCSACIEEAVEDPQAARSRGLCPKHYQRAKRAGQLDHLGSATAPCPVCLSEDTPEPHAVQVRGMCYLHYRRALKAGTLELAYAVRGTAKFCEPCKEAGVEEPARARGLCAAHYGRYLRGTDVTQPLRANFGASCTFDGCGYPNYRAGLCAGHNAQKRRGKPLSELRKYTARAGDCSVEQCTYKVTNGGLCNTHYDRKRKGEADWDRPVKAKAPNGTGHVDENGYRVVQHEGRKRFEHSVIAEKALGRPLFKHENVHHVNGYRLDQRTDGPFVMDERGRLRSGNLEIWSKKQPAGQEVGPKVEWALELLHEYAEFLGAEQRAALEVLSRGAVVKGELAP